jgi:hypothetical protein
MTIFSLQALHDEFSLDPGNLGYADLWNAGGDAGCAEMINAVRTGGAVWADGISGKVDRVLVKGYEVLNQIVQVEYDDLKSSKQAYINNLIQMPILDLSNSNVRNGFNHCFVSGSVTYGNFNTYIKRDGSRAEALWGPGVVVSINQISQCRLL